MLITLFYVGWKRLSNFVPNGIESERFKTSIVVSCRNEEEHLQRLLSCLAQQSYQNFELILVNDHSTDDTKTIMEDAKIAFSNIQVIDATGFGKKNGLKEGIHLANGKLIITTDADCVPNFHWLETIVCFQKRYPSDLTICPVMLSDAGSIFSKLQVLEFSCLIASGAGASKLGMPILCNGANLAFTKSAWLKSQNDLHDDIVSGDDIFLLQSIKKRGGVIRFLKSESAFVITEPANSLTAFINQRRRWASKATAYTDWQLILTSCIVFAISLLPFLLLGFSLVDSQFWNILLLVFSFKYLLDVIFLYSVRSFFQLHYVWILSFFLSILYPFYIVSVSLTALLFKSKSWK